MGRPVVFSCGFGLFRRKLLSLIRVVVDMIQKGSKVDRKIGPKSDVENQGTRIRSGLGI